jgi:hypothetical protein
MTIGQFDCCSSLSALQTYLEGLKFCPARLQHKKRLRLTPRGSEAEKRIVELAPSNTEFTSIPVRGAPMVTREMFSV